MLPQISALLAARSMSMKNTIGLLLMVIILSGIGVAQSPAKNGPVEGLPRIVARMKLTNQSDTVPPTVIFTPKSSGLFRVSIDLILTSRNQGTDVLFWFANMDWTDVTREHSVLTSVNTQKVGSGGGGRTLSFSAKAGTPVRFYTTVNGDATGSAYDVFLVIERLTKIPTL